MNNLTTVTLRIDPSFNCATEKLTLTNGEPETISIDFDPGMKQVQKRRHVKLN